VAAPLAETARPVSREVMLATAGVVVATAASALLARWLSQPTLSLVFVVAVLAVATHSRLSVALAAAFASFLAYNFFFTAPRFTLRVARGEDLMALVAFLVAAVLCSELAAGLRSRTAELARTRIEGETERLRAALLSSVSHDLRSPLSAMIGAASSLSAYGGTISDEDRRELLDTIRHEGERLDRYIQNLLDMTRLGAGGLTLHRDWVAIDELLGSAIHRTRKLFPEVTVERRIGEDLPLLFVHPALIEQALFNVLENAARFSPAGAAIVATAARARDAVRIEITDRGPGIPAAERRRVFDRFYGAERGDGGADRARQGSGLGLTIVRGMAGAHGGAVEALAGPGGEGTTIRLTLPIPEPPRADLEDADGHEK
jgi:two-component system sensor histidine kinase KdpD